MWTLERRPVGQSTKEDRKGRKRTVVCSLSDDEDLKEVLRSYKTNQICTTKYTLLSFIPKNLFEQLHRFANVYFIFLAALNFVPVVEAFVPQVAVIPIILVLSVTAVKDVWEDYRRFKSDHLVNRRLEQLFNRFRIRAFICLCHQ
uniref:P-type ATPase N-terminal domain-containing protein n=1 Tax=Sphaeramia orbicularis TaxID=375764 RepID=A0A673BEU4_9TELE